MYDFFEKLFWTKQFPADVMTTRLDRCLTLTNIIFLGIGLSIGSCIYIRTGEVMLEVTGPAVFISYMLAGVVAFLSSLLYAEMESRIPAAGYTYTFTYTVIGELWAFVIGWVTILRKMISIIALAKAWSSTFDELLHNKISKFTRDKFGPLSVTDPRLEMFKNETGPDILAASLVIIGSVLVSVGARRTANFITFFAILNLSVVAFIVIYGLNFSNFNYWTAIDHCNKTATEFANVSGRSTFIPFGFEGVIKGASILYYAYTGIDGIGSAGEEAISPRTNLPYGTLITVIIITIVFTLMSLTLSLITPRCSVSMTTPFQSAFMAIENQPLPKALVNVVIYTGSLSAMTTVMISNIFILMRLVYAMASDGLMFKFLSRLSERTLVPIYAVAIFAVFNAICALFVDFRYMANVSALATLTSCNVVAVCIIILRYQKDSAKYGGKWVKESTNDDTGLLRPVFKKLLNLVIKRNNPCYHSRLTTKWIHALVTVLTISLFGVGTLLKFRLWSEWWGILLLLAMVFCCIVCILVMMAHFASNAELYFKVRAFL